MDFLIIFLLKKPTISDSRIIASDILKKLITQAGFFKTRVNKKILIYKDFFIYSQIWFCPHILLAW
ncbi:MAG: hypothetical protein A3I32_02730 [Candidatus Yanofskybacteria bacterium RIFCSPLOWO2_02_FULL_45_10]|uniref:Uncharacterized protein n=2 Tax=Candidatus Yanofskyibacteriota TaxID=1752733 RepID=A0A1F8G1V2_9BACT|nr:MAG: hypothetical protein A3F25_00590 [Candidatus Yanofskybacteria bacterium RIFCSPHIGHO2_12_FULL_45_19b]OGN31570.1 MAG: hypothetical protein A3I32_02730 [Candidatus Yanofskybacteria bacterium RIFCSPLOWO2_02_FULL_45_10]